MCWPVTPDGNSAIIPPIIVSAVTAVSAANGVGAGRMRPSPFELGSTVALTSVVSISVTVTSIYACESELSASDACSGMILTTSPTAHPSPPCRSTDSTL